MQYQKPTNEGAVSAVISALTKAAYYVPGKQTVTQQTRGDVRYYAASNDAFPKMPATAFEVWLPALPAPASRPNGPPGTP